MEPLPSQLGFLQLRLQTMNAACLIQACWLSCSARWHRGQLWTTYRSHYRLVLSFPSSWISAPPSSSECSGIRSLQTHRGSVQLLLGARRRWRWRRRLGVPSVLIWGSDFSDVTSLRSSGFRLHTLTPSAAPAAMAAPRAVVSGIDGFTVGYNVSCLPSNIKKTLKRH